ncbi:hypothetical protein ABT324_27985, partial [Saccharopolyspora sp. NPDC000359]|uniref:hypothetical protein n=1 Tax=Saccharopolyspora sp. NPDC000359 TaxID=3154251 RepID=UPI00332533FB
MAQPHDEATRPVRGRAGESPDRIELPFWLDACLLLAPPLRNGKIRSARHAIYPVARALMADRINARGDEAVRLDRTALARWAGVAHAQNCAWIFKYLEEIGFLEIQRHYAATGQKPDTFDVFTTPPANYVGPLTYAELDMALRQQSTGQQVRMFAQVN